MFNSSSLAPFFCFFLFFFFFFQMEVPRKHLYPFFFFDPFWTGFRFVKCFSPNFSLAVLPINLPTGRVFTPFPHAMPRLLPQKTRFLSYSRFLLRQQTNAYFACVIVKPLSLTPEYPSFATIGRKQPFFFPLRRAFPRSPPPLLASNLGGTHWHASS